MPAPPWRGCADPCRVLRRPGQSPDSAGCRRRRNSREGSACRTDAASRTASRTHSPRCWAPQQEVARKVPQAPAQTCKTEQHDEDQLVACRVRAPGADEHKHAEARDKGVFRRHDGRRMTEEGDEQGDERNDDQQQTGGAEPIAQPVLRRMVKRLADKPEAQSGQQPDSVCKQIDRAHAPHSRRDCGDATDYLDQKRSGAAIAVRTDQFRSSGKTGSG